MAVMQNSEYIKDVPTSPNQHLDVGSENYELETLYLIFSKLLVVNWKPYSLSRSYGEVEAIVQ